MTAVSIREVVDADDPAIAAFGRMQRWAYFAPETLIPGEYIPRMLAGPSRTGTRRNFLLVAELNGRVVGGTLFHWLESAGSGFSSFMGVNRDVRGHGIGRRLHDERLRVLDRAAGWPVSGVFIDVVNPTRMSAEQLARDRRAGSDPWVRREVFEHLGFRQVDIRYEQPVGGPDGGPVTDMDLLFCPHEPADRVATDLVVATMQAYWDPWFGEAGARRHAEELRARAHGAARLPLLSAVPSRTGHT